MSGVLELAIITSFSQQYQSPTGCKSEYLVDFLLHNLVENQRSGGLCSVLRERSIFLLLEIMTFALYNVELVLLL